MGRSYAATAQKLKFPVKDFLSKCEQIQETTDLFTFTKEIPNEKLRFLCSVNKN